MLKRARQTSAGEPSVGTTYEDNTAQDTVPGEITVFDGPRPVVFHWWARSRLGRLKYGGSPGYSLEPDACNATLVRHHATLLLYGVYVLAAPIFRRLTLRERTATIEALKASSA